VPLRLDDCNLPRRLRTWQYVDYFPDSQRERAYRRLLQSLKIRHQQGLSTGLAENIIPQPVLEKRTEIENPHYQKTKMNDVVQSQSNNAGLLDFGALLILLSYFVIEAIVYINDTNPFLDYSKILLLTFSSIYFGTKRQLPISSSFKITLLIYMFLYPIVFYLLQSGNEFSTGWLLLMISSILVGGSLISVFQAPMKKVVYAAISLAGFLFLIVVQLVLQLFGIYDSPIFILQFIVAIATAVFMWQNVEIPAKPVKEKINPPSLKSDHVNVSLPTTPTGILDLGWSILPIIFFAMMALYGFGYTDSDYELLIGIVGILTSLVLILKRQIVDNKFVKFSTIFFSITHSLWIYSSYRGWDSSLILLIMNGVAALLAFGSRLLNFQSPHKQGAYSSIFFAVFIAVFAIKLIINFFNIYSNEIQTPLVVLGLIAAIFLWFEQ